MMIIIQRQVSILHCNYITYILLLSVLSVLTCIIYIMMWSCPGNGRVVCLSDLGNILAYYLDKTALISLLY
jgi:hypothetical protein